MREVLYAAIGEPGHSMDEVQQVGPYRVKARLGAGSMGTVYLAESEDAPGTCCALKVLHRKFDTDAEPYARFTREMRIGQVLSHENICQVIDAGFTEDGTSYLAMEYLEGEPLDEIIQQHGPLPLSQAVHLTQQLLSGLQAIHEADIVHRDLKPANLFVTSQLVLKILDFGLAHVRRAPSAMGGTFTRTGTMLGTPAYASPEQIIDSKRVDPRSDIFSAGAIFYTLLSGRPPAQGSTGDIFQAALLGDGGPPLDDRADLPDWVERWKFWLMRRKQEDRPQTAEEARNALSTWNSESSPPV